MFVFASLKLRLSGRLFILNSGASRPGSVRVRVSPNSGEVIVDVVRSVHDSVCTNYHHL